MLLTDLFASTVARVPAQPAVDVPPGNGRSTRTVVSYAQLDEMAATVAVELQALVQGECTVIVLLPRTSAWLYAAQLGVLQAGAAHICLDLAFPEAHLAHVARDAKAVALVTDEDGARRGRSLGLPVIVVPRLTATAGSAPVRRTPSWLSPTSLAYVIYTSGTTGLPKGVLIEHGGVVNLITQGVARFALQPSDRIAQGSAAAYDSSVEEIWLALASGASVVVLDDEAVRRGPDLVPWLRQERITVFCPPPTLLRAMDVQSPHDELPHLRLCYVGGEALPPDLADAWGGALWLENGYGPTECTVTVVRGRVLPHQPVTIGTPVAPHIAWLLDDQQRPVADGVAGELCIAGPGLARGYLGLPELTAQRFPTLPGIGRVYRTGDLVTRGSDGQLAYHGRIDAQVKVRGYRIELEAIETVLARCAGVREVACHAQDEGQERVLVAHIVPTDAEVAIDEPALVAAVWAALPQYMTPTRFAVLAALPRTIGGKIDRKALPRIQAVARAHATVWQPTTAAATTLRDAFAQVLRVDAAMIAPDSDFFALGGDSLRAAQLVSRLRRHEASAAISVRDVYAARTPAALAACLERARATPAPASSLLTDELQPMPWFATSVQITFLLVVLTAVASAAWLVGFVLVPWAGTTFSLTQLLLIGPWLAALGFCAWTLLSLWLAITAKELLIGRYQPQRARAWSGFYVRHWIVVRMVRFVPWSLLEGTEAKNVALRALGARIGKRVHLHRGVDVLSGGWDLLELGDDVTLLREVDLGLCDLDEGHLVVGRVRIGAGATMQTRAGTGPGVEIGAGSVIGALSFVASGTVVPPGELWRGVPCQRAGTAPPRAGLDVESRELAPWHYTVLLLSARVMWAPLVALPFTLVLWLMAALMQIDGATVVAWLCGDGPASRPVWVWATIAFAVIGLPISLLAQAFALRNTPGVPLGTHARWSWVHLRLQLRTELLEAAGTWLSGTLFWPAWLRLAGMRIGRDCEVSTILDVLPETTQIGSGSFLADGVYLGVPSHHQGRVTVAMTTLGERTFVGNHAVIDAGQALPADLLLGVSTIADDQRMQRDTGWFGQPAFSLPRREVIEVDRRLTHQPGALRYANRVFWEGLRVVLPALPVWLALWWFDFVGGAADGDALLQALRALAATLACGVALAGTVLLVKWLLLGRVRPGQHGLWSCWASRWDFHYVLWQRYGRALLQPLEGTLLLPWFLRAIGMRIGRRCVLGDGFAQVVDPDMIAIGDGATVHALFQAHSFEDRVLKIDRVHIGARATIGRGTVVLYGADIREGAHVAPHSVVMKHELLLADRAYAGSPTSEVARAALAPASARANVVLVDGPRERELAFDVARGFAVLGMLWLHFLPEPEDATATWAAAALQHSLQALEGVPAALFFVLAGIAWANAGPLRASYVARRSLTLAAVGVPFWLWVWPNDVLLPMALALPVVALALRGGRGFLVAAIAALLAAVPLLTQTFASYVTIDGRDDGTHIANHEFGWCTWRYFFFDGAYPLMPWLALPLLGALLAVSGHRDGSRWRRWLWLAVPLALAAIAMNAVASTAELGDAAAHLTVTWQPTSLPFLLRNGGLAIALVALLAWRRLRCGLPRWLTPIAAVGRASLTHYLGHILLVYAPLRWWWPAEDWSLAVGLTAALGYATLALVATPWWLRRRARGPLEALLAMSSCGSK